MAEQLTVTAAGGSMTATLVGAWELRAGSHDTTEYLDGAADVSYPVGVSKRSEHPTVMGRTDTTQHPRWQSSH